MDLKEKMNKQQTSFFSVSHPDDWHLKEFSKGLLRCREANYRIERGGKAEEEDEEEGRVLLLNGNRLRGAEGTEMQHECSVRLSEGQERQSVSSWI